MVFVVVVVVVDVVVVIVVTAVVVKGLRLVWLLIGNPPQSYGASVAIWDHAVSI